MDQFAENTHKAKVLSIKLQYAKKHMDDLEYEKIVVKSCVSKINMYMQHLVETHDSVFTVSVWQHLLDKLQQNFSMLNQIEGVLGSGALPKHGEKIKENLKQSKPLVSMNMNINRRLMIRRVMKLLHQIKAKRNSSMKMMKKKNKRFLNSRSSFGKRETKSWMNF